MHFSTLASFSIDLIGSLKIVMIFASSIPGCSFLYEVSIGYKDIHFSSYLIHFSYLSFLFTICCTAKDIIYQPQKIENLMKYGSDHFFCSIN
jgi:hypothetical protein